MNNLCQYDDNPYPRYTAAATTAPPRIPLHRRPRQDILHQARPFGASRLTVVRKGDLLTEEHEGSCVVGIAWGFIVMTLFYGAVGWAIAALLRDAIR